DEALRLQKQVNQFLIENLEGNHPSIAASHNNIASIFQSLDRYEEALTQQQKAISILKQTLESDHPDLIKCYGNLATIFQSLGRYEEAIEVQEYVVTLMNSTLGFNSFLVATSYNNLASMYKDLEQFQEAIKAQRKSMFYQLKSNPEHPSMGICYHNMGEYFFNLNHIDSAMFYGYKAYSILKKTLPNSHHLLKAAEKYLSIYNIQSGQDRLTNRDCEGARKHFYEALTYSDSIQAAVVYYLIGDSYYFDKEFELSIKNYNLSYSIEKYDRSIYLNSLCLSYLRMNNFPIAEELLKEYELVSSADGFVYRNWAIYHALQNQPQLALTNLEKALKLGFNDLQKIEEEEAFEVLRDEPRYQAIVEQLRNRN
ncbi:MAG: tetratricopeptide repeat protein, partial [Bacteroidota bacterium]